MEVGEAVRKEASEKLQAALENIRILKRDQSLKPLLKLLLRGREDRVAVDKRTAKVCVKTQTEHDIDSFLSQHRKKDNEEIMNAGLA